MSKIEKSAFLQKTKGAPSAKFLQELIRAGKLGKVSRESGGLDEALAQVTKIFGDELVDFIKQPGKAEFREQVAELTPENKQTISQLQRVWKMHQAAS